MLVSKSL